ncbi:MAG: ABC transporter ATP-binding protein [Verrucomicrobiota bacterium]
MKIELQGLTKTFDSLRALDRVRLEIEPGQIVAVVGANGAGKSTLLRCLSGIVGATEGLIFFDQEEFQRDRVDLRRRLMFLPDFPYMFTEKTALEHIGLVLRAYEADQPGVEERVISLLREFDLLAIATQPLNILSRGQRYKSALIALLAIDPELWLLDEPMASGMDPHGINSFKREALAAVRRGRTIIYTTQILELAEKFSDRVCVIHKGEARAFDTASQLKTDASGKAGSLEAIFDQLRGEGG